MKPKAIAFILSLGLLTACNMTLPIQGQLADGSETFAGTATGGVDGSGTLSIKGSKGRTCVGNFVYVTQRSGEGTFTCSDGQSGPFRFVSTTSSHSSGAILRNVRSRVIPALFTRMSRRPKWPIVRSIRSLAC